MILNIRFLQDFISIYEDDKSAIPIINIGVDPGQRDLIHARTNDDPKNPHDKVLHPGLRHATSSRQNFSTVSYSAKKLADKWSSEAKLQESNNIRSMCSPKTVSIERYTEYLHNEHGFEHDMVGSFTYGKQGVYCTQIKEKFKLKWHRNRQRRIQRRESVRLLCCPPNPPGSNNSHYF